MSMQEPFSSSLKNLKHLFTSMRFFIFAQEPCSREGIHKHNFLYYSDIPNSASGKVNHLERIHFDHHNLYLLKG